MITWDQIELKEIDRYLVKQDELFNEEWKYYETDLKSHLKQDKSFKDWVCKKEEGGGKIWINMKTFQEKVVHPGVDAFD